MSLQEQINKRIASYKETIAGISQEVETEWHIKQINTLNDRVTELEWVLGLVETEKEERDKNKCK